MKINSILILSSLGVIGYLMYQKSKQNSATPPQKANTNTLQIESKPSSSDSDQELPISEKDAENEQLFSPTNRPIKEQMTDVVMGGGKMCFNAMKF